VASLFDDDSPAAGPADALPARTPLAERMRPRTLDEIVGQAALLAPGRPLREAIDADVLQSIILWGPPGTGKTTLARVIADTTKARFVAYSAVTSGIKEIKAVMAEAEETRRRLGRRTMLFVAASASSVVLSTPTVLPAISFFAAAIPRTNWNTSSNTSAGNRLRVLVMVE